jgi:MFS family permease
MNLIVLTLILANIGTQIEQRFFPLYVRELGGSPANIGLLAMVGLFVMMVLSPLGGWLTDRYRRVKLYAFAPVIGAVGCLLMWLAPTWGWLIPGQILNWMPGLLGGPALFGLISDMGPDETRGTRFAYQMAGFGVCAALGPLAGGFIYKHLGYQTFLLLQAAMLCLAAFLRSLIRDPREASRQASGYKHPGLRAGLAAAVRLMVASRQFVLFLVVTTIVTFGIMAAGSLFSVYMSEVLHVDQADMGVIYSIAGVAGIVASLIGGVASDRMGRKPVLAMTVFGLSLTLIWFSGARTLAALGAVWLLQGFFGSLGGPAMDALFADLTERESRGTIRSVFTSVQTLIVLPAPLLGGFLWERVAPAAPFWTGAGLVMLGGIVLLIFLREPKASGAVKTAEPAPPGAPTAPAAPIPPGAPSAGRP